MNALSIRQPWAWLICAGYKVIENRVWPTTFRGRIYVHAGQKVDHEGAVWLWENRWRLGIQGVIDGACESVNFPQRAGIIGEVDIVDCVTQSASLWFEGPFGFVLRNPTLYERPIPCRGRLGFFEPQTEAVKAREP